MEGFSDATVWPWANPFWLQRAAGLETQKLKPVVLKPDRTPHSADWPGAVPEGPWAPIPLVLLV